MEEFALRLYTELLAPGAALVLAAGTNRILYVAEGHAGITAGGAMSCLAPNSAWHAHNAASVRAGADGVRLLRFELAEGRKSAVGPMGEGIDSRLTLLAPISLERKDAFLLRCDRVIFPPGGVAYSHTHQGPGIRCLQQGRIRIDSKGASHHYEPGQAWFESGPDTVFAAASETETTAFVRFMLLPRGLVGRSSIAYVDPADRDKPKTQSYQVLIDAPIEIGGIGG